jgi:hypothetical protein
MPQIRRKHETEAERMIRITEMVERWNATKDRRDVQWVIRSGQIKLEAV